MITTELLWAALRRTVEDRPEDFFDPEDPEIRKAVVGMAEMMRDEHERSPLYNHEAAVFGSGLQLGYIAARIEMEGERAEDQ